LAALEAEAEAAVLHWPIGAAEEEDDSELLAELMAPGAAVVVAASPAAALESWRQSGAEVSLVFYRLLFYCQACKLRPVGQWLPVVFPEEEEEEEEEEAASRPNLRCIQCLRTSSAAVLVARCSR
jgi:hypothetical protein